SCSRSGSQACPTRRSPSRFVSTKPRSVRCWRERRAPFVRSWTMNEHDEAFDAHAAYARYLATQARRPNRAPWYLGAGLAAAAVLAIVFAAPIGSVAQSFLTIFQPTQFAAIDVS